MLVAVDLKKGQSQANAQEKKGPSVINEEAY
jgi:hypothetical protein